MGTVRRSPTTALLEEKGICPPLKQIKRNLKDHDILSMLKDFSKNYPRSFRVQEAEEKESQMGTEKPHSSGKVTLMSVI